MTDQTTDQRRQQYADAIKARDWDLTTEQRDDLADAVMAVADAELRAQRDRQAEQTIDLIQKYADARLRRDAAEQEAAATATAAAHLATLARQRAERAEAALARVRARLDAWEQRLPETVRTATVIDVLRNDLDPQQ